MVVATNEEGTSKCENMLMYPPLPTLRRWSSGVDLRTRFRVFSRPVTQNCMCLTQHFTGKHCPETIRNLIIATEQVLKKRPTYRRLAIPQIGEARRSRNSDVLQLS